MFIGATYPVVLFGTGAAIFFLSEAVENRCARSAGAMLAHFAFAAVITDLAIAALVTGTI